VFRDWLLLTQRCPPCCDLYEPHMSILPVFFLMCTQDLRRLKLSKFRNFHYFRMNQTHLFWHWQTVTTAWPFLVTRNTTHEVPLFLNSHLFIYFFSLICLTAGHSFPLAQYDILFQHVQQLKLAEKFGEHIYPPQSSDMNLIFNFKPHLKTACQQLSFGAHNEGSSYVKA
jgi:hypothetical protein